MKREPRTAPLVLAILLNAALLVALFWTFHVNIPRVGSTPMQAQLISSAATPAATPSVKPAAVEPAKATTKPPC